MARYFDGTTNYLTASGLTITAPITLLSWTKCDPLVVGSSADFGTGVSGSALNSLHVRYNSSNIPTVVSGNNSASATLSAFPHGDQFHPIIGVLSGSSSRRVLSDNGAIASNATSSAQTPTGWWGIGAIGTPAASGAGWISAVAAWNVALDDRECWKLAQGWNPLLVRRDALRLFIPRLGYSGGGEYDIISGLYFKPNSTWSTRGPADVGDPWQVLKWVTSKPTIFFSLVPPGSSNATGDATTAQGAGTIDVSASETITGTSVATAQGSGTTAPGTTSITGDATTAQGANTIAASGTETMSATVGTAQGANTAAASGSESYSATVGTAQGANTIAASATETISGTATTAQGANTISASGVESYSATTTTAQGSGTTAGTETETISATVTTAQGANTIAASGTESMPATVGTAQGANTIAASATETITGSSVATAQGGQSIIAGPPTPVSGDATLTQGSQSIAATGVESYSASVTTAQGANTAAATGVESFPATVGTAQGANTAAASGSETIVGSPGATAQGSGTTAATASETINASSTTAQGGQSIAGSEIESYTATVTTAQGGQSAAAVGSSSINVTGTCSTSQSCYTGDLTPPVQMTGGVGIGNALRHYGKTPAPPKPRKPQKPPVMWVDGALASAQPSGSVEAAALIRSFAKGAVVVSSAPQSTAGAGTVDNRKPINEKRARILVALMSRSAQ